VLFADQADRNDASVGVGDGYTEKLLRQKDALGVMAQCVCLKSATISCCG
jgi:hypothetical protein